MSALSELNMIMELLSIPVETGVFSKNPPNTYVVLTPLTDMFDVFADNKPTVDIAEIRISLFTKKNYLEIVSDIVDELYRYDFTITERRYIEHEDDTGYYHYAIDVAKYYII